MSDTPATDPLTHLLAPPGTVETEALRQALLVETTRRLRRFRRLRIVAFAAGLAACYVAGLLTMHLLTPAAPAVAIIEARPTEPAPGPIDPPVVVQHPSEPANPSERAALLRQEGDRHLNEEHDPEAALQTYGNALNVGTDDDAKFSPDDNWLLMAIKNAREKEARNGDSN
jgi:hypothetical protein